MKARTFRGRTMSETLDQVKREFGRGAVILNTRTTTRGRVLGLGGTSYVEITAAKELADLPPELHRGTLKLRSGHANVADGAAALVSPIVRPSNGPAPSPDLLLAELGNLRSLVENLVCESRRSQAGDLPPGLFDAYLRLVRNTVAEELARDLVARVQGALSAEQLSDPAAVRTQLATAVEAMLPTAGPIELTRTDGPTVVALIGPTGVGKTTTVAKLAANFALRDRRRVGLITIDTYRIAAIEQLRTYADIINVPLEVVSTPRAMSDAAARLAGCELVLVDTAGRSQRDREKMDQLREYFTVVPPDEIHLVLSGAADQAVLREAVARFKPFGLNRVIFTKLDEAVGFGAILSCLQQAQASLSYVTTGQDVPDDIRVGERQAMTSLILGDRSGLS